MRFSRSSMVKRGSPQKIQRCAPFGTASVSGHRIIGFLSQKTAAKDQSMMRRHLSETRKERYLERYSYFAMFRNADDLNGHRWSCSNANVMRARVNKTHESRRKLLNFACS